MTSHKIFLFSLDSKHFGLWITGKYNVIERIILQTELKNLKNNFFGTSLKLVTLFRKNKFFEFRTKIIDLKIQKKESIKHENGSQLFEFRLLYWS